MLFEGKKVYFLDQIVINSYSERVLFWQKPIFQFYYSNRVLFWFAFSVEIESDEKQLNERLKYCTQLWREGSQRRAN